MKTYILFANAKCGLLVTGTSKELFPFCEDNVYYFLPDIPHDLLNLGELIRTFRAVIINS